MARDTQRSKLYDAERASGLEHVSHPRRGHWEPMTVPECQALAQKALRSAYVRRRHPSAERVARRSTFEYGRSGGRANQFTGEVRLGLWARQPLVVLHEVAHLLTPSSEPAHGWKFAATFLDLVRAGMGVEAHDKLKASFTKHKVRFRAPQKRAPLSPERKAALTAQLAAARQAKAAASPPPKETP